MDSEALVYTVRWDPVAVKMTEEIRDRRIREAIYEAAARLALEPEKQGKPLVDELSGLRSTRCVGQRYRVIYRVDQERVIVLIVSAGIRKEGDRKDIYARTLRYMRRGFLSE